MPLHCTTRLHRKSGNKTFFHPLFTPWKNTQENCISPLCQLFCRLLFLPALSSLSQCTPPTLHPLFTVTWLCLMTELTPAYRIKLISTKRGSVEGVWGLGGGWRRGRGGGGKGRTTTGGQEKSTAGSGHNKEQAAWWLVLGLMFGRMLGVAADERGGLMACFQKRKQGWPKRRVGQCVTGTNSLLKMFGCVGSEVTATIEGTCLHIGNTAAAFSFHFWYRRKTVVQRSGTQLGTQKFSWINLMHDNG